MATSDVEICNLALIGLNANTIIALDGTTEESRKCLAVYARVREQVLCAHPWNFAIARVALSALSDAPLFDYDYAFQIPTECLRVIKSDLDVNGYAWVREGDQILANDSAIKIKYIKRITDPNLFSADFIAAFAARLESDLAYPITGNADLAKAKYAVYTEKLRLAKATNSQEGRSLEAFESDAWLNSRNTGLV